jgi:hypothetical protein
MKNDPPCKFSRTKSLLAFIHIEKTGGETLKWILRSSFGISHCDISPNIVFKPLLPHQLSQIEKIYPSLRSIAGHPVTPYVNLENTCLYPIRYATFLRQPLQQCASYFQYLALTLKRYPAENFEEWIHTEWPRNIQTKRLCGEPDSQKAISMIKEKKIFIGLMERFDESIFLLKQWICPDLYLGYQQRNQALDNTFSDALLANEHTRALIENAVREDIRLYRWVKDILYPQYTHLYLEETGMQLPDVFPYRSQNYRHHYIFANRLYRNIVYRPLESLFVRK